MMKTTGAAITEIIEAYGNRFGQYVRIGEIAAQTDLTKAELFYAIKELMEEGEGFDAVPEIHRHRITDREHEVAPVIYGEARHLIRFEM